ncbi:MAG: hypothetical protein AB7L91_14955 [Dehalococcoidia bacterium]
MAGALTEEAPDLHLVASAGALPILGRSTMNAVTCSDVLGEHRVSMSGHHHLGSALLSWVQ